MDSKRKAAIAASDANERTPKRLKTEPSSNPLLTQGETAETTTEYGLKLLGAVQRTQDKNKRLVATNFMNLPDKNEAPGYYDVIKLPVALDSIESKLNRGEFPNLSTLESLFKRMITNAKQYNVPSSEIWQDAERLRKVLSSFMKEHNPAYKLDKDYQAQPTPIPGELPDGEEHDSDLDAEGEPDIEEPIGQPIAEPEPVVEPPPPAVVAPRGRGRPRGSLNKPQGQRSSTTPVSESRYTGKGYTGLTFQQAQEKIIYDLQAEADEAGDLKFEVFITLPPRTLKDYYKVIPNPVSLRSALKHVKNGKEGVTPYRSWKSYEEEISLIWKNAFHYNEDGSEISNLAQDLKTSFYARLAEARQEVAEPSQPKIKLKVGPEQSTSGPQKITLRMPGRASPALSPAPAAWNDASMAHSNGVPLNGLQQRQQFPGSHSSTPVPYTGTPGRAISLSGSVASPAFPPAVPFKNEEVARPSSSLSSANLPQLQNGHGQAFHPNPQIANLMPPPRTPALSNSFSGSQSTNAYGHNVTPYGGYNQDALHSKWRLPGKNESDALITKVTIATHPDLNISRHFQMDVLPSPDMSQQSVTINLPSTHYYLEVFPNVARHVANRQHKLFLTANGARLQAMPKVQGGVMDRESQVFVVRLVPGVNRIELEIIAALPKGAVKGVNGSDVELEKFSIFANLLK